MPAIRQRVLIGVAVVVGAVALLLCQGVVKSGDGSGGLSLLAARNGVVVAVAAVVVCSAPAVGLGWVAGAAGSVLAGPFVVGGVLVILAARGGPIDDYLRAMPLPGGYVRLAAESVIWAGLWGGFLAAAVKLAPKWRARLPKVWLSEAWEELPVSLGGWQPWAAGGLCAVVAAAAGMLLVRSSDVGQVLVSMFIAFCLGGLAARSAVGRVSPMVVLLSPAVVAVGGYLWLALQYGGWHEVLSMWYRERLAGLGLVLPIHYFSAGVAGAALGFGWGQMLAASKAAEPRLRTDPRTPGPPERGEARKS